MHRKSSDFLCLATREPWHVLQREANLEDSFGRSSHPIFERQLLKRGRENGIEQEAGAALHRTDALQRLLGWGRGRGRGGGHKEKQTGILWLFWATWLTLSLVLEEEVVKKEEEEEVKEKEEDDEAV